MPTLRRRALAGAALLLTATWPAIAQPGQAILAQHGLIPVTRPTSVVGEKP